MKTIKNDEDGWWCDECGIKNSREDTHCYKCDNKKPGEEDEMKILSSTKDITENMNFRFPKRTIPY